MFAFLKRRAFLVVLGFALLALFLWLAGPYFSFADYRPLESTTGRLIAIALVVGVWAGWTLLKRLRANRASDQLVAAVVQQSREPQASPEALRLREQFEEAVKTLKQKRRSGHSLYDLPWYVIIGAPGSGKTTALVNSGLHFPLEQRTGKGSLRGIGGTRNCDWWFTDEAIFLDTAGRYTTQDSDATADSAGWSEFLSLLRKYRKRRPVNGVILTISAQDLMLLAPRERETHVTAARRRLDELNRELRIQLPVYLMVTKCDLVAGFAEYFDDLSQEGRTQVWGVTFPYADTLKGKGAEAFPVEFDALIGRLNARLFARLEEERDSRRRTKMFAFPQQMAALREVLAEFVAEVFGSTRFDQQILLRGVYFTSGTQEGTPIDRLLGAIGRRFAVSDAIVAPAGRGKAYFMERLLKQVLLGESGLAGVNRRHEVQKAALQLGAYAAMALVALLGVVVLTVSYSRNRAYVTEVGTEVARLREVPPVTRDAALQQLLPRLDAVRMVVDSAERYRNDTPWAMRWGLYQGNSLGNAARDAYERELDGALLLQLAVRIEQRLVESAAEPEKLYEYLKAYLMLGEPARLDRNLLGVVADLEWRAAYANPEDADAVNEHFSSLLDSEDRLRPIALNQELVAQARSTIQQASIPRLIYSQIKLSYADDETRALRLDVIAGVGADQVLTRKSGRRLSEPVPSLYTKPVFDEVSGRNAGELVKQFGEDSWVWGESRLSFTANANLASEVNDIYEKDYIAAWDAILADFDVSFATQGAADALAILAGPTSPLRGLLKAVDEHTFLVRPPETAPPSGVISSTQDRLTRMLDRGRQAIGLSTKIPGAQVTAHFAPIHQLMAGQPGAAPIDRVLGKMQQLQQQLSPVGTAVGGIDPLRAITTAGSGELVKSLRQDAATLPPAVGGLVARIADRAAGAARSDVRGVLETRYQQEVVRPCTELLNGRYPLAANGPDAPLADFGRVFGYNGVFDDFFKQHLEGLVLTSGQAWRWRTDASGAAVGGSVAILRQFELAQRIRDMFFAAGAATPQVRFTVTPSSLDAGTRQFLLEIDGQNMVDNHGPARPVNVTWPGARPVGAATFEERGGMRVNIVAEGTWAWFRLLDAAQVESQTDVRYLVTFARGGHEAKVSLEAASLRNPFGKPDLEQFRCAATT
jgi:type VI secretion system protein ImpL